MPYPDNDDGAPEASALDAAWDSLELWLEENFTPDEVRRVMEKYAALKRGSPCAKLTIFAQRTWGVGCGVTEYPEKFVLDRPGHAPLYLGSDFGQAKGALILLRDKPNA